MKIGIDISQLAFPNTGVANYLENLIDAILKIDTKNEYVFFFSSLRGTLDLKKIDLKNNPRIELKMYKMPPSLLNLLWNKLHKMPIERFIGPVDLFITSDWTEPPAQAKKATIIYDLIVYKNPEETAKSIIETQKNKLKWVKKESSIIFAISKSTKKDIEEILGIDSSKIKVIYPGIYPVK